MVVAVAAVPWGEASALEAELVTPFTSEGAVAVAVSAAGLQESARLTVSPTTRSAAVTKR